MIIRAKPHSTPGEEQPRPRRPARLSPELERAAWALVGMAAQYDELRERKDKPNELREDRTQCFR